MKNLLFALMLSVSAVPANAVQQTATLAVSGMSCAACPITVKTALSRVAGVSRVEVDFDKRQAIVNFDDAKTNVRQLTHATAQAGFSSTPKLPKP